MQAKKTLDDLKDLASCLFGDEQIDINVCEDCVLLLLAAKLSMGCLLCLKTALAHIPSSFSIIKKSTDVPLRYILVPNILSKRGFKLSPQECHKYAKVLDRHCPAFLLSCDGDLEPTYWQFTKEEEIPYNRFLAPPVDCCLSCDERLRMQKNDPSKAVIHRHLGPQPASNICLECRQCNIKYGVCMYTDEDGDHFYPENIKPMVVEASNVNYMEKDFYSWLPSLG